MHEFFRLWETGYVSDDDIAETYDYGILLGGIASYDVHFDRQIFNRGADRILQTIRLYKKNTIRKIIITSGSGIILDQELKEADFLKAYLLQIGIPEEDIIIENQSRNTFENAVYTKKITDNFDKKSTYLLLTSAFHMRRVSACFSKAGFEFDVYSTNLKSGKRKFVFDDLFIPDKNAFFYWDLLIHEVIGFVVYKIIGYA